METSGRSQVRSQKWVLQLLKNEFFQPCNCPLAEDCNLFCNDCLGTPFCKSCKPTHEGHTVLQIRKTSRSDSIHAGELNYLLDVSGIQRVMINGAKVVYLKPSNNNNHQNNGQERGGRIHGNNNGNRCECCNAKLLQGNYRFCSVYCKSFIVILFKEEDPNHNSSDDITENSGSKRRKDKCLSVITTPAMKSNRLHSSGNIIENGASKRRKEKYLSIVTNYAMKSKRTPWR